MNYIHIANATMEPITLNFDDDEVVIGVSGESEDDGILSLLDNGFLEANQDIFGQVLDSGCACVVSEEEAGQIRLASQSRLKSATSSVEKPRMVIAPSTGKPKVISNKQAQKEVPKGNREKNMEHYRKELEGLGSDLEVDVSKLRTG